MPDFVSAIFQTFSNRMSRSKTRRTIQAPDQDSLEHNSPEGNSEETRLSRLRSDMVETQLRLRGITDSLVLSAMQKVPRHLFVSPTIAHLSYDDGPLPIGYGATISQPYIVAYMTEVLQLEPHHRVLEIGSGCGYQTAILSCLAGSVYSVEINATLAARAARTLADLGITNAHIKHADGYYGWPGQAPFDAVIVTAAPTEIPPPLIDQLQDRARLIVPVGMAGRYQSLVLVTRHGSRVETKDLFPVSFVPMTGEAGG